MSVDEMADRSLAMRRLYRHASHGKRQEDFDDQPCISCGVLWSWNTYIYPADEPRRCSQCAPDEYWETGVDPKVANRVFLELNLDGPPGVM